MITTVRSKARALLSGSAMKASLPAGLAAALVVAAGVTFSTPAAAAPSQQGFLTYGGFTQAWTWPPSSSNNQFCMDIWGDSLAPGAYIDSTYCNGTPAQNFVVNLVAGGYIIQPGQAGGSGLCLTAGDAGQFGLLTLETCVASWGINFEPSQVWNPGTDGTWRNAQYGDCMSVANNDMAESTLMVHTTCNGQPEQELWAWGHNYTLQLAGTGECLTYQTVSNYELVLQPCSGDNYQQFTLWNGGAILAAYGWDGSGNGGVCLGWDSGGANGCNENLASSVQVMAPGGYFNCLETATQPSDRAWFIGAQQPGMNGSVYLYDFGGGGCLDQCGDTSTAYPNKGWTQPGLAQCSTGNAAQAWNMYFIP
jgi:hypothetical protein